MIEIDRVGVATADVTLLAPVSASVSAGDALVVRGRNGSGKSTLLRTLAGARTPTSGRVSIAGSPVAPRDPSFRRRVAAMIGLPPIAPDLTVFDHVLFVATTWTDAASTATTRTEAVMAELGLTPFAARFAHELSSGQTQLFALALVLVRPFDVLLLDEPEQRLDPEHIDVMTRAVRARRDAGATLVVATHSTRVAERLSERMLWLESAA
ncbi:ATP-binding cassette domain-containing protein [Microbacterium koreense]|uniref:ATP-binding cassette domain-containing protein n=1 Tax=Microbacterium koreense TaxID=323761 RepID=A0ABW2ZU93_9MICO